VLPPSCQNNRSGLATQLLLVLLLLEMTMAVNATSEAASKGA
jgi:hypothetical protein